MKKTSLNDNMTDNCSSIVRWRDKKGEEYSKNTFAGC